MSPHHAAPNLFRELFRRFARTTDALDWLLAPPVRLKPMPALEAQAEPDAMTLLAGLRSGRWVA